MPITVTCLGDSITRGQVSASYIDVLAARFPVEQVRFLNAGVNNDLTDNVLRRVPSALADAPDFVTVLAGTNDVIASLNHQSALFYILNKQIYRWPELQTSGRYLARIVRRIRAGSRAKVALTSIPVLGEDLHSLAMQRVRGYNARVRAVAAAEGVAYLPVFERMEAELRAAGKGSGPGYDRLSWRETARLMARRVLLREDFDEFSARQGFQLLTDSVHLNCRGAEIVAGVIEEWLRGNATLETPG